jgi:subtilisin family serine protease
VVGYRTESALAAALRSTPASIVRRLPAVRAVELRPRGSAADFAAAIAVRPGIDYVEALNVRASQAEPALFSLRSIPSEWQYSAARVDSVPDWVLRAASGITIAVIDTGADLTAPDLAAKAPLAYDVRSRGSDVRDLNGHGTFVASLAAGSVTNAEGMSGFGGDARLMIVRSGRVDGAFSDVDEAAGIVYAVDNGAKVINLSVGGPDTSLTERRAVDYAVAHGALLVAAAGNERKSGNAPEYPAALLQPLTSNGVGGQGLAVGASTSDGSHAGFSNTGSYISLAAPGVDVFGAVSSLSSQSLYPRTSLLGSRQGFYGFASGTSFSSPEVAGAAALVWAANPSLDAQGVAQILKQTASGLGSWSPELGFGVIDVAAAVAQAGGVPSVLVSAVRTRDRVHLSWSHAGASSYRVAAAQDAGPAQILLSATPDAEAWFKLASGHTYSFTVTALDATGVATAVSAPLSVRVGLARASLSLATTWQTGKSPLRIELTAVLKSSQAGVPTEALPVQLEFFDGQRWRAAGRSSTDSAGRASWSLSLGPGSYAMRALFDGGNDLLSARSRSVSLVVR